MLYKSNKRNCIIPQISVEAPSNECVLSPGVLQRDTITVPNIWRERSGLKIVQSRRVFDQKFFPELLAGRDQRQEVDQISVVRHVAADVWVRPVGAPQHTSGSGVQQRLSERNCVQERGARRRNALGAADLDPAVLKFQQTKKRPKRLLFDALTRLDAPHVVDDKRERKLAQNPGKLGDIGGVEMND